MIDVTRMSAEELKQLLVAVQGELRRREEKGLGKVKVTWEAQCDARHLNRVYLAVVTKATAGHYRCHYSFLELRKPTAGSAQFITVHYEGYLMPGTTLKGRSYAFGSRETECYYRVSSTGTLDVITEEEAFHDLGIIG